MSTGPAQGTELLDGPLWCVRLEGRGLCAAETAEGFFLALFTSSTLASQFIRDAGVEESESPSPGVYSRSRAQFISRARTAAADGLRGTLVDLQSTGQVREIIPFRALGIDGTAAAGWSRWGSHTLH